MEPLNPVDLIIAKRNGDVLLPEVIRALVQAYTDGVVPDYQMSAFLMASYLRGMSDDETNALTEAMLYSGDVLDLSDIPGVKVDKHSTGGVGDKVSLVLAPVVAAAGVPVPMISGRGLGHSGGTLDKLESIPGFKVDLPISRYRELVCDFGIALIGQTAEIAPADRKLYALRDVTGTVDFIPFIAASIMSKKLAEGIDALVLDVKCGRGAFMKSRRDARLLAEKLVGIGNRFGKRTVAWLTAMDAPLGYAIGNWPEVVEAIDCLRGGYAPLLRDLTLTLAGEMICLGGRAATPDEGRQAAEAVLADGSALEVFRRLVEAQGGDVQYVDYPERRALSPSFDVVAPDGWRGYVSDVDALVLGRLSVALGAGRVRKEDEVDATAGIVLNKTVGDPVEPGEMVARVFTHRMERREQFEQILKSSFEVRDEKPEIRPLLFDRYENGVWRKQE